MLDAGAVLRARVGGGRTVRAGAAFAFVGSALAAAIGDDSEGGGLAIAGRTGEGVVAGATGTADTGSVVDGS